MSDDLGAAAGRSPGLVALAPPDRYRAVAGRFGELVAAVEDWSAPTPVVEWRALDVVSHLVGWVPGFLAGGGVQLAAAPVVDDGPAAAPAVDDDPVGAWAAHAAGVQALLDDAAPATGAFSHPQAGTHELQAAVDRFVTADVFMHTWDLARSIGADDELDPAWAAELLAGMEPIDEVLRASGQYGPRMPVADDASPGLRLMAFVGRDPSWERPSAR